MEALTAWSQFVAQRVKATPLTFYAGARHAVKGGNYCPMHWHHVIEVVYHPTGRGTTRIGKEGAFNFEKGGVVVYAPNEPHDQSMETDGDDLCLWIGLPPGRGSVPKQCFHVPNVDDTTITEDIRLLSHGHIHLNPVERAIFNLRATSTLYALINLACSRLAEDAGGSTRRHVLKAEQYIRDRFSTIKSLREVSSHLGISYDHLRHEFKIQCGKSPGRYLTEVRIERAKTLMLHSRLPLKQIATMCGFSDEYYFSTAFRNFTGMPPGRYRTDRS